MRFLSAFIYLAIISGHGSPHYHWMCWLAFRRCVFFVVNVVLIISVRRVCDDVIARRRRCPGDLVWSRCCCCANVRVLSFRMLQTAVDWWYVHLYTVYQHIHLVKTLIFVLFHFAHVNLKHRGGATILRVGVQTLLRAERAEIFLVYVPPSYDILGGGTAENKVCPISLVTISLTLSQSI